MIDLAPFLPYAKQWIEEDDMAAVAEALRSDWLTTGPRVEEFEKRLAERVGARYVVAFNSGTAALHGAYFAAGVREGDEVVTSPITFAATANAALYLGARPVFADIEEGTTLLDPGQVEKAITSRTRVIAPVDFAGQPADMDPIREIARKHGLVVVEDAAHSLGAAYKGRPVGSLADMTIFSFHPVKHITTGEGGAVATDNEDFYGRLLRFRSHGMVRERERLLEYHGPWYHEMQDLGYNYRLTDIQCALGLSQLGKLDRFVRRRRELAAAYRERLQDVPGLELPVSKGDRESSWHLFVVRWKGDRPPRREIFEALRQRGIGAQVHYIPVYRHPYYRSLGYPQGLCPIAEDYYSRCMSLPLYPAMTDEDLERVVGNLREAAGEMYCQT